MLFALCVTTFLGMLVDGDVGGFGRDRSVAVEGLPGRYGGRTAGTSGGVWWLLGPACVGWLLAATMPLCTWLWQWLGVISVPVDTTVWIVALVLTVLAATVLWRRFHRAWIVVSVIGVLLVGGTSVVLWSWHGVYAKAWVRMECGNGDCATPGGS